MSLICHIPFRYDNGNGYKKELVQNSFSSISSTANITMIDGDGPIHGYLKNSNSNIYFSPKFPNDSLKEFSICFWMKFTYPEVAANTWYRVFNIKGKNGETTESIRFAYSTVDKNYRLYANGLFKDSSGFYQNSIDSSIVPEGEWAHITLIMTQNTAGSKLQTYVNGEKIGEVTSTYVGGMLTSEDDNVQFPGYSEPTFSTSICDFRIYSHELSQYEVKEITKRLFVHYTFDDADYAKDSSPFKNHPLAIQVMKDPNIKKFGSRSAKLTGTHYVAVPQSVKVKNNFTFSIWAYADDWTIRHRQFISCYETGGFGIEFDSADGYIGFNVYDKNQSKYIGNSSKILRYQDLSEGWHLFTGTFDGSNLKGYVDGELITTSPTFANAPNGEIGYNANNTLFLGGDAGGNTSTPNGNYFYGYLDDFRFYLSVLSEEDIKKLYKVRGNFDNRNSIHINELLENDEVEKTEITSGSVAQSKTFIENEYYITPDGAKFLKIFSHKVTDPTTQTTVLFDAKTVSDEALYQIHHPLKFSRMRDIPNFISNEGKYEFLLTYPDMLLSDGTPDKGYNRWRQTANPLEVTSDATATAESMGYESVEISWTAKELYGIGLSSSTNSYFDCQAGHAHWFSAIGVSGLHNGGIPTAAGTSSDSTELYIRIDNTNFKGKLAISKDNCIFADNFNEE